MVTISERAAALTGAMPPAVRAHYLIADDLWSAANPDGYVNLGTAENHLLWDLLEPKLTAARAMTAEDTHYQDLAGMPDFRAELARYLGRQRSTEVDPEHLVVLSGGLAALHAVAFALCDPGDGIVVPTPYYGGFDGAFAGRNGAVIVPAPLSPDEGFRLSAEAVERAVVGAPGAKAVALLSPSNPLGHAYDAATLKAVGEVVDRHGLQLIVDEVYAGSVYDGRFVSAAMLGSERVHLVWGFAKDFGLSGFKTGVLHSLDPDVRAVAQQFAMTSSVSSDTQVLLRDLLKDDAFTSQLGEQVKIRLAAAYARTSKALAQNGIGHMPAAAGLFVWIDLRPHLREPTYEAEEQLRQRILAEGKVNLTPGAAFHSPEPGWFRICFAGDQEAVRTGLERLGSALDGDQ